MPLLGMGRSNSIARSPPDGEEELQTRGEQRKRSPLAIPARTGSV